MAIPALLLNQIRQILQQAGREKPRSSVTKGIDRLQQLRTQLKPFIWVWMSACIISVLTLKLVTLAQFVYLPLWVCVIANTVFPIWCVIFFRSALCAWHLYKRIRETPVHQRQFYPTSDLIQKTQMHLVGLCFSNASLLMPFLVYCMAMREYVIYSFGLMLITLIGSVVLHSNLITFLSKNLKCAWFQGVPSRSYDPWQNQPLQNPLDQQDPNIAFFNLNNQPHEEIYAESLDWQNNPENPASQMYMIHRCTNDSDPSNPSSSAYPGHKLREQHTASSWD